MAHITLPDGRELDEPDGDPVLDYYRGIGATVEESVGMPAPPYVITDGEIVKDGETVAELVDAFDPTDRHVDEVLAYLAGNPDDADRVIALERDGKNRVTITGWTPGEPDPSGEDAQV